MSNTVTFTPGTYILTNPSIGLPIKPQYNIANSYIICHKNDYSHSYEWALEHITNNIYTIKNVGNSLYAFCSNNVQPPAEVVIHSSSHYFCVDPVPGATNTYTIKTIDSGVYLGLSESAPGARLVVGTSGTGQLYQWVITKQLDLEILNYRDNPEKLMQYAQDTGLDKLFAPGDPFVLSVAVDFVLRYLR